MGQFNVKIQPRETGSPPAILGIGGSLIRTQADADRHATETSSGRYTVIPSDPKTPATDAEEPAAD